MNSRLRLTLALLFLTYVLSFIDRQIVAVVGPQIREAFSLGQLQIGLLYGTAFSVVYALAGIPMGWLADRVNRRNLIAAGLAIWSLMTVVSGFATSFGFLVAARLVLGVSQAMLSPAVYSLLADAAPASRRATIFSWYASAIFIGVGLSFLVGGTIAALTDWRTAMIAVGAPGIALAVLIPVLIREPERGEGVAAPAGTVYAGASIPAPFPDRSLFVEIRALLAVPSVRWHLLGFSALACTGYTILAYLSTLMREVHARADLIPHIGWFLFGVSGMVVLSGRVADWLAGETSHDASGRVPDQASKHWARARPSVISSARPARRYLAGVFSALAPLLYIPGFYAADPMVGFSLLGLGLLVGSSYNGVAAALVQYYVQPGRRALAGGLYLFVISIAGFGLGPPLAGWLMDRVFSGPEAVPHALSVVFVTCSGIALVAFRQAMRRYAVDAVE